MKKVGIEAGIELCKKLYSELSRIGYYPALTGGLLYKNGLRKDIDIVIYRNRQDHDDFEVQLKNCGLKEIKSYGFVTKCKWNGINVDLFNPESKSLNDEEYAELKKEFHNDIEIFKDINRGK